MFKFLLEVNVLQEAKIKLASIDNQNVYVSISMQFIVYEVI